MNLVLSGKSIIFFIISLLLLISNAESKTVERVAAVVNNKIITLSALNAAIEMKQIAHKEPAEAKDENTIRKETLWELIDRNLLINEAERFGMANVSDTEITEALTEVKKEFSSEVKFTKALERWGMDIEEFKSQLREQIISVMFVNQRLRFFVRISEEDIKKFYNGNLSRFNNKTIDEVRGEIEALLTERETAKKLEEYIKKLRSKAEIKINVQY
ncbi:MAG: SurA N-terminal domain-containing protein [Nitrospirae bacterium]|nr:SurA N-terminal domain-containing protein [Nitrospirota bacterium]